MELLIFDLGGVIFEIDTFSAIARLSSRDLTPTQSKDLWCSSPSVGLFESGGIGSYDFAQRIITELDLFLSPEEFLHDFEKWILRPYEGILERLGSLRGQFALACLSNTNGIHLDRMEAQWRLSDYFDFRFFSFEMGCVKPDERIFNQVIERVPHEPDRMLFFDDSPANIKAARRAGIPGFTVESFESLDRRLSLLDSRPANSV